MKMKEAKFNEEKFKEAIDRGERGAIEIAILLKSPWEIDENNPIVKLFASMRNMSPKDYLIGLALYSKKSGFVEEEKEEEGGQAKND
jgi:hypothetical protein